MAVLVHSAATLGKPLPCRDNVQLWFSDRVADLAGDLPEPAGKPDRADTRGQPHRGNHQAKRNRNHGGGGNDVGRGGQAPAG